MILTEAHLMANILGLYLVFEKSNLNVSITKMEPPYHNSYASVLLKGMSGTLVLLQNLLPVLEQCS